MRDNVILDKVEKLIKMHSDGELGGEGMCHLETPFYNDFKNENNEQ